VQTLPVCLFLALACCLCSAAPDNNRTIAQFAHAAWGSKDGAPSVVKALAQSADGYLWVGSHDGLYRFDGVNFERYQPQSGGPFPAKDVTSLLALPNGDLWIAFKSRGLTLLRNGNATTYPTHGGVLGRPVSGFAQDREGTIWAVTGGGLARLEGDRWKEVGKDWNLPERSARAFFLDRRETLWVATEDTLVFSRQAPIGFSQRVGQVSQIAPSATGNYGWQKRREPLVQGAFRFSPAALEFRK
jgi:ligand-binding sensor domain-containing protein